MERRGRMAGSYEIIEAFRIGDREIVVGEDTRVKPGERYLCAYCQQNEILASYSDVLVSGDYCGIVQIFADRLSDQAQKTRAALLGPIFQGIDTTPLSKADCQPVSHEDSLEGKIVVIKPEVLRREYQRSTEQIKLCTGGFGAYPHSRGSACYCVDLYSGKESRFERQDILGTLERSQLPQWAEIGLKQYELAHPHRGNKIGKERER